MDVFPFVVVCYGRCLVLLSCDLLSYDISPHSSRFVFTTQVGAAVVVRLVAALPADLRLEVGVEAQEARGQG